MRLTEHAAKLLFLEAGIPAPEGVAVDASLPEGFTPPFAPPYVVKSQVLAGGRGKAGGIRIIKDPKDLAATIRAVLDLDIQGQKPPYVRIEPAASIEKEYYLSLAVSRARKSLALTAGREGGVNVEASGGETAPLVQDIPLPQGPGDHHIRAAFFHLQADPALWKEFHALVKSLFALTVSHGLLLAEINPLAVSDGRLIALDGKVEIDDNFADMRPDFARFYDPRFVNREEALAKAQNLSFIKLSGWVGLMVNGAGLAMVTMDLLNLSGLPAANFLDLGGAADATRMRAALSLLFDDPAVRAVFINLYGGILSCGKVAEAIREVLGGKPPQKTIVARLSGNSAEEGRAILRELGFADLHIVSDMDQAVAALAEIGEISEPMRLPRISVPEAAKPVEAVKRPQVGRSPLTLDAKSVVCVQGITGKTASLHARLMREYGTSVACGVTPFKGGQTHEGVPVYNSLVAATRDFAIDASVIFVPGRFAPDAILEAADAGIPVVICITEGISQQDMLAVLPRIDTTKTTLIGPNTPGVIVPGAFKAGIMPVTPFLPGGRVAVFSRSGTLTYEACRRLSDAGIGQAVGVGIGGDPFIGAGFVDLAEMVREDDRVDVVLALGEIGGSTEEELAAYVAATKYPKPVVSFIAGVTAPPGRRLGHAGAIIEKEHGVADKLARLEGAGIAVCRSLSEIAPAVQSAL